MPTSIGIFDSGIGGLTVFQAVARRLPAEQLIYLGDTARVPYGTKSASTVIRYSLENARFLLEQDVKAIVVACNTASALAVPTLASRFSLPLVGVLEPGAERAVAQSRSGKIGVIGTAGTVASGAYTKAIRTRRPDAKVFAQACPLFVPLVEEGWLTRDVTYQIAEEYLAPLRQAEIDTLILGCTHYPLLKEAIAAELGPGVTLIDSAEAVAESLAALLRQQGLSHRHTGTPAHRHRFYVTDSPERFKKVGEIFLGQPVNGVQTITL